MLNYNTMMVIVLIAIILMFGLGIFALVSNHQHKKKIEELTLYQINTNSIIDMSIPETLGIIINESFDDYKVKELLPLEEGFINSERESEIRRGLTSLVTSRISNAALDKLSLFYNIENVADILADKIYIIVMQYTLDHNAKLEGQTA